MVRWATRFGLCVALYGLSAPVSAQTNLPGYVQAEAAFMHLTLDQRVKLQVLLTAAGYWPAVPDAYFSGRLFNAILRFEGDNGFVPLGILTDEQMDRLTSIAAPYLNAWRFEVVRHPTINNQIWVPMGLPLVEEPSRTGLRFANRSLGVVLTYDFFPEFDLRFSFESLRNKLERSGATIHYSKLFGGEFFALSYSDGITDAYVRYHQMAGGGIGFSLYWNHASTEAHIERIATLISASLWSSASGAPFTSPFSVTSRPPVTAQRPKPALEPPVAAPPEGEAHSASSGTGILVTDDGFLITNAHVVKNCSEIRVSLAGGVEEPGKLVAKDEANDLALVKVNSKPSRVGALRFGVRLGESVEAFG